METEKRKIICFKCEEANSGPERGQATNQRSLAEEGTGTDRMRLPPASPVLSVVYLFHLLRAETQREAADRLRGHGSTSEECGNSAGQRQL